jgi:ankyrin repeat protein
VVESDEEVEPEWEEQDADEAQDRIINEESNHQSTPMMRAAKKGHWDVVNLLCQQGADVAKVNWVKVRVWG